ncbi:MAG: carboxypeptidase-like regulatory domain-containing protein [bacterium]|nr:carboxypeptidase-like regulatory domain-containing protein [bacterium]
MKKVMYASLALGLVLAFACAKKPGVIEGKATLDGAAAGNAGIAISVSGTALNATTDDAGAYKIEGVVAGQYTLEAKKEGYDSKPLVGIVVEAGKTLSGQDINLTKIVPPAPAGVTAPAAAPAPAAAAPEAPAKPVVK